MTAILLGMDVGGSRTRALLADEAGAVIGYGEAGPGNHEVVGYEGLHAAMLKALERARSDSARRYPSLSDWTSDRLPLAGAGFGVAGFDWEDERVETMSAIGRLGLRCPVALVNDADLGLAAGSEQGWGLNVCAGTSNNCRGMSRDGRRAGLSGAGGVVGENGGALEIAAAALRAVNHARIRRGPPTMLEGLLCAASGKRDADHLIESLAMGTLSIDASWAPWVFRAAREGDAAALAVIDWAGRELGESAAAVARQLGMEGEDFEVVLSGSLFSWDPPLSRGLLAALLPVAPGARPVRLHAPPVIGAVVLGAGEAGLPREPLRAGLIAAFPA